jgi:hypothetical protein
MHTAYIETIGVGAPLTMPVPSSFCQPSRDTTVFRFQAEGKIKNLVLGTADRRSPARRQKIVRDHDRIIGDVRHQVANTKIQEMRSVSPVPPCQRA